MLTRTKQDGRKASDRLQYALKANRSLEDILYWMIEVAPSTKTLEAQFVKQLYVFCVAEIGTANPYLIVLIEQLLGLDSGQPFELDSMARIGDLLNSVKRSRYHTW